MEINDEEFGALIELLEIHAGALSKLVNDNQKFQEQIDELYKDRIRDKLMVKASILSIVNSLSNKRIMDPQQFLAAFKAQIMEDKSIFDSLGIDVEEILNGGGPIPPSKSKPKSKPEAKDNPSKSKSKAKIKDGIIDFKDFKKGN